MIGSGVFVLVRARMHALSRDTLMLQHSACRKMHSRRENVPDPLEAAHFAVSAYLTVPCGRTLRGPPGACVAGRLRALPMHDATVATSPPAH